MSDASARPGRIFLSAFGIRLGGGLVLLRALMGAVGECLAGVLLDARLQDSFQLPPDAVRRDVPRSFIARLRALDWLGRRADRGDILLCFNSLPPLRRLPAHVIAYVHSPQFVGRHRGIRYAPMTAVRIYVERLWFAAGVRHCDEVWVQTPSMADAMRARHPQVQVHVVPFVDDELATRLRALARPPERVVDASAFSFFYPADAVGHKNHPRLLQAWKLLAQQNLRPRLMLTLRPEEMQAVAHAAGIDWNELPNATSLGYVPRERVLQTLGSSSALLFPSRAETLGLPMLEAMALGIPILAAERDFVRDVCAPAQSFDPDCPMSIAMAVRRFMGLPDHAGRDYLDARGFIERLRA